MRQRDSTASLAQTRSHGHMRTIGLWRLLLISSRLRNGSLTCPGNKPDTGRGSRPPGLRLRSRSLHPQSLKKKPIPHQSPVRPRAFVLCGGFQAQPNKPCVRHRLRGAHCASLDRAIRLEVRDAVLHVLHACWFEEVLKGTKSNLHFGPGRRNVVPFEWYSTSVNEKTAT